MPEGARATSGSLLPDQQSEAALDMSRDRMRNPALIEDETPDITSIPDKKPGQLSDDNTSAIQSQLEQARQAGKQMIKSSQGVLKKINKIFDQSSEKLSEAEREQALKKPPRLPKFPIFMFPIAVLKDLLDIPGDLSTLGIILTTATSITLSLMLLVWTWSKISGGWWKKRMIRWILTRFIMTILVEFIPYIKIIPTNALFLLMAHYHETKLVKGINRTMEAIHKHTKKV